MKYDNRTYRGRLKEIVSLAKEPAHSNGDKKGGHTLMRKDYRTTYYRPMLGKTFEAALNEFVTRQFRFLKGTMIINLFFKDSMM